jgi:uncharacterized protein YbjT (DUF2867 family)
MTIAVVGATGIIGSRVTRALLAGGQAVRAVARDHGRATSLLGDVEVAVADLNQASEVDDAFRGVDRAVVITANGPRQLRQEINVVNAAQRAGVRHLAKLSVGGAAPEAPLTMARDHWAAEERLRESGVPATVIRPGFFMQNLLQYAEWIQADGSWSLPLGDGQIAMVDASDVADVVATVVVGDPRGEVSSVTGPAAITMHEVAATLGDAAGRTIRYVDGDPEEYYLRLVAEGYSEVYARDLTTLYDQILRPGYAGVVSDGVEKVLGRKAHPFADFAAEMASTFKR